MLRFPMAATQTPAHKTHTHARTHTRTEQLHEVDPALVPLSVDDAVDVRVVNVVPAVKAVHLVLRHVHCCRKGGAAEKEMSLLRGRVAHQSEATESEGLCVCERTEILIKTEI